LLAQAVEIEAKPFLVAPDDRDRVVRHGYGRLLALQELTIRTNAVDSLVNKYPRYAPVGSADLMSLVVDKVSELEALVSRAVVICSWHDNLLAGRLMRILRLPAPKSQPIAEVHEDLEAALTIFSYLRAEGQLHGLFDHAQIEACVEEVVANLATRLVEESSCLTGLDHRRDFRS
jgi:hypothetical protein